MLSTQRVQRAAEDAGGAAAARGVHLRDDRGAQDPDHDPVALPALRLQADPDGAADRAPRRRSCAAEKIAADARGGAPDRAPGGRVGARRAVAAGPGDRLRRRRETLTREIVADVLGVADRRAAGRAGAARCWTATRARRCGCSRAPPTGASTWASWRARSWASCATSRIVGPASADAADLVDATARRARGGARAGAQAPRGGPAWSRCSSIAGRAPSTRRRGRRARACSSRWRPVDLCQAEPLVPMGDLLERLEGLEARLRRRRRAAAPPASAPAPRGAAPARAGGAAAPAAPVAAPTPPVRAGPVSRRAAAGCRRAARRDRPAAPPAVAGVGGRRRRPGRGLAPRPGRLRGEAAAAGGAAGARRGRRARRRAH